MSDNKKFLGFSEPKQNWSKLPHEFIDALNVVETVGELKVILYILRHTWGYRDDQKRITLDEFANGRKRRDGSRIDGGTGLTIPTIRDGLLRAQNNGFITIETDDSDQARIQKFYSLTEKDLQSGCKTFAVGVQDSFNRTEKETLEEKPKENNNSNGGVTLAEVYRFYEGEIGMLSATISEMIGAAFDEFGGQTVVDAIQLAATSNVRKWAYVDGILKRWRANGKQLTKSEKKAVEKFDYIPVTLADGTTVMQKVAKR